MTEQFKEYWDKEVKPLADKCTAGVQLLSQLEKATTYREKKVIKKQIDTCGKKDWFAPFYISKMVFSVEHDLADGRTPSLGMSQVRSCLNSEDYYKKVFNGKTCEESQNYRALGKKLNKAVKLLCPSRRDILY